ncbi:MAG: electron transfer flavoprotein subunit beta/FixA family protein [Planctomycetota bacterium]|nr:electron transfer flavoprotein subunit beta/FixA family protein [Planctomycetota bacterium]
MKIVVCIKRVPDTETKVRVASDGKSLEKQGVNHVLNPYDEYAVEEAIRIKEKHEGEVTVVCLGPKEAAQVIRNALAMGADKAVHLLDEEPDRDPMSVARALAEALKEMEFDILFFGRLAVDDQSSQVGPAVAHLLDLPCVIDVGKLEIGDGKVKAYREVDAETYVVEATLPVVLTANKGLNEPRYPSLKGIMAAKKKPLEEKPSVTQPSGTKISKMEYPPERQAGKIVGKGTEAVPELVRLLHEEAKVI